MARLPRTRIRIILSRGHYYAQEVLYRWDRNKKRGVTRVIRTLGPVNPTRGFPGRVSPQQIRALWEVQQEEKARASSRVLDRSTRRLFQADEDVERHSSEGAPQEIVEPADATLAARKRTGRSLTGREGLEEFDRKVLRLVGALGTPVTRLGLRRAVVQAGIPRPNHHQSIEKHVSFSLTRLHGVGFLSRTGTGGRGDMYRYQLATDSTNARRLGLAEAEPHPTTGTQPANRQL
jgi:hypothetical protein